MASFDDPNFFTNSIFAPFDQNHLAPSQDYLSQHRHSVSSTSDIFASLSPSVASSNGFHAPPSLNNTSGSSSQSPRSSASPHSNAFFSDNSVSDVDLDELLNMSSENREVYDQKPQFVNGQLQQPQNMFLPNFGTMGNGGFDFGKLQADQLATMLFQQQQQQNLQQHLQQQHQQQHQQQQQQTMAPQWMQNQQEVLRQQVQYAQPQNMFDFQNAMPLPTNIPRTETSPIAKPTQARAPARRGPKPKDKDKDEGAPGPSGGKHNKTERRYRQKVQAAQSELRDAVPALRVLYGTSTEEQKRSTDIKAVDGSVDGLGEITRPNASAKTTIFVGAKLYIELLQDRVAGLQRRIEELENYRSAVGGQEDLDNWKADFEGREEARRAAKEAADRLKREQESEDDGEDDDDEEEEEVVVKRKKARKVSKKDDASTAVRTFAAFAMTFSFLPSADKTFTSIPIESGLPLSNPTAGQVIGRIPIITAEHASRLLARGLPAASVPHPSTLVEWGWRVLVAIIVAIVLGPIFRRIARMNRSGLWTTTKEAAKFAFRVEGPSDPAVSKYATYIIGGINDPSTLSRWFTILHLNRTASDSRSLALLALLQPISSFLASPESVWKQARASITETTPATLVAILDIPFAEAADHLDRLPVSSDPLGGLADQLGLYRLNDLYTRMFTMLVFASAKQNGPLPTSTKALLENLDSDNIGPELKSSAFEQEIRATLQGSSKGTPSHALGLVLIGLWGIFAGPNPSSQAALATALAAEEMAMCSNADGSNLASVSAMLNLLYPGSSAQTPPSSMLVSNNNALALDRLALICIEYIKLLLASPRIAALATQLERADAAKQVQRITTNLRLAITQVDLEGVEGEDKTMLAAKERLVGVLSIIGRRARGRADVKDEDSGVDAETDEL